MSGFELSMCSVRPACCIVFFLSGFFGEAKETREVSVCYLTRNPKQYVRIEIAGLDNKTTFTDNNGMFVVTLKGGRYTIRVIETPKRMEFSLDVPQTGTTAQTFLLGW